MSQVRFSRDTKDETASMTTSLSVCLCLCLCLCVGVGAGLGGSGCGCVCVCVCVDLCCQEEMSVTALQGSFAADTACHWDCVQRSYQ